MFHKIKEIKPLKRYVLLAIFQDGTVKMYDVGHLFDEIEIFNALKEIPCLFHRVKVDIGGYGISWNDEIDYPVMNFGIMGYLTNIRENVFFSFM